MGCLLIWKLTGVEPKKNGYTSTSNFYYSSTVKAPELTNKIKAYAETKDWLSTN